MIDHFTREQFEEALPIHKTTKAKLWEYAGLKEGEHSYLVEASQGLIINVRSSVKEDGQSAGKGEDSIRCWLTDTTGAPMASKVARWITRQRGWQDRMRDTLRYLYKVSLALEKCPRCGNLKHAFRVRKAGPNKGRVFQNCDCKDREPMKWLPDGFTLRKR